MNHVMVRVSEEAALFSVNMGTPSRPDWFNEEVPGGRTIHLSVNADGVYMAAPPVGDLSFYLKSRADALEAIRSHFDVVSCPVNLVDFTSEDWILEEGNPYFELSLDPLAKFCRCEYGPPPDTAHLTKMISTDSYTMFSVLFEDASYTWLFDNSKRFVLSQEWDWIYEPPRCA